MFVVTFSISYRQMQDALQCMRSGANHLAARGSDSVACCMEGVLGMMHDRCEEGVAGKEGPPSPGKMPLTYFAWLVYAAFLSIRVVLIYKNFAHTLQEDTFLGPSTLQVTVAAAGAVFLVFLLAHHDAAPESRRRHRIDVLTWSVLLDVVDAVDLLGVFLDTAARDNMAEWVEWTIMSIVCLNFVLPTVLLMVLSKTHFGARPLSKHLQTLHRLLVLLGVNGPLLAARLFLWQHLHLPISTFAIKNVGVPFLMLYSIYDYAHHQRLQAGLHEVQEMIS
ncbi:uncharacterized protein LOC112571632 [Pomacea canaliculata]|uniref:uncharacterized protein LOC112571632 n=1 Tax=Pomacea canaliculata TaxID=400727 RepID=UPI000D733A3D|nr:uncharacterized protein LOC112571632 [Pomacea canaliculata]